MSFMFASFYGTVPQLEICHLKSLRFFFGVQQLKIQPSRTLPLRDAASNFQCIFQSVNNIYIDRGIS